MHIVLSIVVHWQLTLNECPVLTCMRYRNATERLTVNYTQNMKIVKIQGPFFFSTAL